MSHSPSFHSAKMMGGWIVEMANTAAAHDAVAHCRAQVQGGLEVRQTLWGVQVRTDRPEVVQALSSAYEGAPAPALAA